MRRLTSFAAPDGTNALWNWRRAKPASTVLKNIIVAELARYLPLTAKNALYRGLGVRIGRNVAISYKANMDVVFPELLTIGSNTIIGFNTTILCHEFLIREWRTGPVVIGRNVMIGANCTILPGVAIGNNAVVSAMTFVNRDVPPSSFARGNPMTISRKR